MGSLVVRPASQTQVGRSRRIRRDSQMYPPEEFDDAGGGGCGVERTLSAKSESHTDRHGRTRDTSCGMAKMGDTTLGLKIERTQERRMDGNTFLPRLQSCKVSNTSTRLRICVAWV